MLKYTFHKKMFQATDKTFKHFQNTYILFPESSKFLTAWRYSNDCSGSLAIYAEEYFLFTYI